MEMSLNKRELKDYLGAQLNHFFPDKYKFSGDDIDRALDLSFDRMEYCYKHINVPHYNENGVTRFSHLHADQYAQFLYFFSNSLWKLSGNKPICDKIINLNHIINSMFFSYKGELPDIFIFIHPVGTIIGNAVYNDFLVIMQNVTINTRDKRGGVEPVLGKGVCLCTGSKVMGNSRIGNRVSMGVNTIAYNEEIPDDSVVILDNEHRIVRSRKNNLCMAQLYFNIDIQ